MNPLFKGEESKDTKDLLNFIIKTLHEEINKVNNIQMINNINELTI